MPRNPDDKLFLLIQSMTKAEKRNFSIYMQRNPANRNSKVLRLFATISNIKKYEEQWLLKKLKMQNSIQLPNLKANLYKQILESRCLLQDTGIEIELHDGLTYARVLYKKGLYRQSLQLLKKVKVSAAAYNQLSFLLQCVLLEIKIEKLIHADAGPLVHLTNEVALIHKQINITGRLNTVYLDLCNWHLQNGFSKWDMHISQVKEILSGATGFKNDHSFYPLMYLNLSYAVSFYIKKEKKSFIKYVLKVLQLFEENPHMKEVEADNFLQALYYNTEACYLASDLIALQKAIDKLQNNTSGSSIYISIAKINRCLLKKNKAESILCLNEIESSYSFKHLNHLTIVLLYKMALLSTTIGDYNKTIDYALPVINSKKDIRRDIQCEMRLLHLTALCEVKSLRLIKYLTTSYIRFIKNKDRFGAEEKKLVALIKKRCRRTVRVTIK